MLPEDRRTLVVLGVILVGVCIAGTLQVVALQEVMLRDAALANAELYSSALREFRTVYTSEVVERVKASADVRVTHDYVERSHAIPLPATLSILLGERIGRHLSGAETHLYSAHPFPWRAADGGLRDDFRRRAWSALRADPQTPVFEFTTRKGHEVLRYATADVLRPSCVGCHNSHPLTPKTGWRAGDVRGVLEVIHPMGGLVAMRQQSDQQLWFLGLVGAFFGLLALYFLARSFGQSTARLQARVQERTQQVESTQRELAAAQKMAALGGASAGLAHELNQPLGAMKLTLEGLQLSLDTKGDPKLDRKLGRVVRQVDRIAAIVQQLRVFSHASVGASIGASDVHVPIAAAIDVVEPSFEREGVVLHVDLSNEPLQARCEPLELERVLTNLLTNARQATADNVGDEAGDKAVWLSCAVEGNWVAIRVRDNGCGISEEDRERVFEPFYTTKEIGAGSGLGLSLCYGAVRKYGGTIQVEAGSSLGASFLITLPLADDARAPLGEEHSP